MNTNSNANDRKDNVISLFERREQVREKTESSLDETQEKNRKNKERLQQERLRTNGDVLKSFQIKK